MIRKNLIKNNFLCFQKILFICWGVFFILIESPAANDAKIQLKKIQEKIKHNKLKQNELKKKQSIINKGIKEIESSLKKNESAIQRTLSKKKITSLEIDKNKNSKKRLEQNIYTLTKSRNKIIYDFIKDNNVKFLDSESEERLDINTLLVNIYKNILRKIEIHNKKLNEVNILINLNQKALVQLERKIENINKNILDNINLETTLQGENLITSIQKKEKELENIEISQKAKELRKLIESLRKTSKSLSKKKVAQEYNLKKIENILPINLKSIEKIRTDSAKKGIFVTLKQKSFLTTPKDGLVVYADSFKGYGNMIILDLGNNYHIIYSGLTNIMCVEGDWLNAGSILGKIEMEYKVNEVYLEVRFKGKTLDPSSWLKS